MMPEWDNPTEFVSRLGLLLSQMLGSGYFETHFRMAFKQARVIDRRIFEYIGNPSFE